MGQRARDGRIRHGAVALFLGCFLLAACSSPQARYRVLSFFFDGVPPPGQEGPGTSTAAAGPSGPSGSTHQPFQERRCNACHETAAGSAARVSLGTEAWGTCRSCHADPDRVPDPALVPRAGEALHGPIAVGECATCHEAHASEHPALLRVAPGDVEALCAECHVPSGPRSGGMAAMACQECHDPHGVPERGSMLLIGGREQACTRCHELDPATVGRVHGPVAVGACGVCHDAHGGPGSEGHVRGGMTGICRSCHEQPSAPGSDCARGADCAGCHDPHAADAPSRAFPRVEDAVRWWRPPPGSEAAPAAAPSDPEAARRG